MKIGILTLPLHTNYGGNLQAFALMRVLKEMGHEVWLIDRQQTPIPLTRKAINLGKYAIKKYILNKKIYLDTERNRQIISRKISPFLNTHITPRTIRYKSSHELLDVKKYDFDAYIVGSDQVWRPQYTPNIEDYFLSFLGNSRSLRISYAASFGAIPWEISKEKANNCKSLIQNFDHVSVREDRAVQECKERFNITPTHVLDPTMLLDVDTYINLINDDAPTEGNLLVYILDPSSGKNQIIETIAKRHDYTPFNSNVVVDDNTVAPDKRIAPSIESWIKSFNDAKYVITDSFHACVFSILFNKPFTVYGNNSRGMVRFESLLTMFGLEDRLVMSVNHLNEKTYCENIDWIRVNNILETQRAHSFDFLKEALK